MRLLRGLVLALVAQLGSLAVQAQSYEFASMATVSATMGVNAGRLCVGEGSRQDIGCPTYAPSVNSAGLLTATNISATNISLTGNISANRFLGDGSGLTGVTADATDRITSGTTSFIVISNTGYISLTQASTNTGWFDPTRGLVTLGVSATGGISGTTGYFGTLQSPLGIVDTVSSNAISSTNVSATTLQVGAAGSCGASTAGAIRYTGGALSFCNGSAWTTLGTAGTADWFGITNIPTQVQAVSNGTPITLSGMTLTGTLSSTGLISASTLSATYVNSQYLSATTGSISSLGAGAIAANTVSSGLISASNISGSFAQITRISSTNVSITDNLTVGGTITAGAFVGDGSGLTGVTAAATDRITSGTTQMVVVSNTGFVSLTQAGTNTGWFDPTRGLVTLGVSATGGISSTALSVVSTYPDLRLIDSNSVTSNTIGGFVSFRDAAGNLAGLVGSQAGDGFMHLRNNAGNPIVFTVGGNEDMRLNDLGLGIKTTDPSVTLHVSGTLRLANAGESCDANRTGAIRYTAGDFSVCRNGSAWETFTAIANGANSDRITSGTTTLVVVSNSGFISLTQGGSNTAWFDPTRGLITLGVNSTGGISGTTGYFTGNVGIGGVVPSVKLNVMTSGVGTDGIVVQNSGGNSLSFLPALGAGNLNGLTQAGDTGIVFSRGVDAGTFVLVPWANGVSGLRMIANGYVALGGLITPTTPLDVSGTVKATRFEGDGSGLTGVTAAATDRITSGTTSMVAVSNTGFVSLTQAGTNTGWFDPTRGLVTLGVSTTGTISGTAGYFSGRLGVGTATPGYLVEVYNASEAKLALSAPNAAGKALVLADSDGSQAVWELGHGAGSSAFALSHYNGSDWSTPLTVASSGNVGIGSAPSTMTGSAVGMVISSSAATTAGLRMSAGGSDWEMLVPSSNGNFGVYHANSAAYRFYIISGTGYVGIGTTAPAVPLDISGTGTTTPLYVRGTGGGYIRFYNGTTSGGYFGYSPTGAGGLAFLHPAGATVNAMFTTSGSLGIGSTAPATSLTVVGEVQVSNSGVACSSSTAGAIRYTGGTLSYCNGSSFTSLSTGGGGATATDRISTTNVASGANLGMVVADIGTVSFTLGGTAGAAYLHPTLGFVGPGVSTTGAISATTLASSQLGGNSGSLVFRDGSGRLSASWTSSITVSPAANHLTVGDSSSGVRIAPNSSGFYSMIQSVANSSGLAVTDNGNNVVMKIRTNVGDGRVGIGSGFSTTVNSGPPSATLHVSGTMLTSSWTYINANPVVRVTPTVPLEVSGTISATALVLNGVPITGGGTATDRISTTNVASGANLGMVVADIGTVSFTLGGTAGAAYLHPTLGLVGPGVSITTGVGISTTNLNLSQNTAGQITGRILMGGNRYMHRFFPTGADGYNTFAGLGSGNTSMAISGNSQHASNNTAFGQDTLSSLTTGYQNTVMGALAGTAITSGSQNTGVGNMALYNLDTAQGNTGLGKSALFSNTSGNYNTAVGVDAVSGNTTASENVGVGAFALLQTTTGSQNTAVGTYAMYSNTIGTQNTALGKGALYNNVSGSYNVGIGIGALNENRQGDYNTALGNTALYTNVIGSGNSAFGIATLYQNTGSNNIAMGNQALYYKGAGSDNVAIGYGAGRGSGTPTQDRNTLVGSNSGFSLTTAEDNTMLGYYAGNTTTTGDRNIIIGHNQTAPAASTSDYLNIGGVITANMATGGSVTIARNTSFTNHVSVTGNITAAKFFGDGSALTGISGGGGATDRISTSGVSSGASLGMAVANIGTISFTLGGTAGAAYLHPTLGLVGPGVSTTGGISGTTGYFAGNVGIGTTTPSYTLDILGNVARIQAGSFAGFAVNATGTGGREYRLAATDDANGLGGGKFTIFDQAASASRMVIDASGNMGIGTTTPSTSLHILSSVTAAFPYRAGLILASEGSSVGNRLQMWSAGTVEAPQLQGQRSRGTLAAPTAVDTDDALITVQSVGYDGTGWGTGGGMSVRVGSLWTTSSHETNIRFTTIQSGSTTGGERMRITGAGNVGIGATAPAVSLTVVGEVQVSNSGVACSSSTAGAIRYTGGTLSYCNGSSFTSLAASGGGATPTDRISTTNVASGANLGMVVADIGTVSFTLGGTAGAAYLHPTLGLVGPGVSTTGGISGTNGYFSGNVGIGTTAPGTKLAIYQGTGTSQFRVGASANYYWDISRDNDSTGDLVVRNYNTSGPTERFRVSTAGNIGIDDTTPLRKLTVRGNAGAGGATFGGGVPLMRLESSGSWSEPMIEFAETDFDPIAAIAAKNDDAAAGDLIFLTRPDSGALTERVRILGDNGYVGISNTAPIYPLDLIGTATYLSRFANNSGNAQLLIKAGTNFDSTIFFGDQDSDSSGSIRYGHNGDSMVFRAGATNALTLTASALTMTGDMNYTGTLTDTSDRRLKTNIKPLAQDTATKLGLLKPVSFEMRDRPGVTELGFIAQDVEKLFPALVQTAKDPSGTKSLNYVGLIAPLVQAVQELQETQQLQQRENMLLKKRIEQLEQQLQQR